MPESQTLSMINQTIRNHPSSRLADQIKELSVMLIVLMKINIGFGDLLHIHNASTVLPIARHEGKI